VGILESNKTSPEDLSAKEVKSRFRMAYRASPKRSPMQGTSTYTSQAVGDFTYLTQRMLTTDIVDLPDVALATRNGGMPFGRTICRTHRTNRTQSVGTLRAPKTCNPQFTSDTVGIELSAD